MIHNSMRNIISSFKNVTRCRNSLYVVDIDDTLFYYPNLGKKWWNQMVNHKTTHEKKTLKQAEHELFYEWENIIPNSEPQYTDEKGSKQFFDDCLKMNNDVIFLTARHDRLFDITKKHVNELYPEIDYPIYFSNEKNKGDKLKEILNKDFKDIKYDEIHFIDDLVRNCYDVQNVIPTVKTYLFNFKINTTM